MILSFYNYEECCGYYTGTISNLRQNKLHGIVNIAKPVLLLAVMQLVDEGWLRNNRIILTSELEDRYAGLYNRYEPDKAATPVYYPFYHLHSDGFWHIRWIGGEKPPVISTSRKFIVDHIDHVCLDDDLWILLLHQDFRLRLMDFIINRKLAPVR